MRQSPDGKVRYGCALLVLAFGLSGCGPHDSPTSVENPEIAYSAGGAGDFSAELSPTVSDEGIGPLPLGEYPHPTLSEIKVTGVLSQFFSDAAVWNPPGGPDRRGQFFSLLDAAGVWNGTSGNCHGFVRIVFSVSGGKAFCDSFNAKPITDVWADTVVNRGTGTVFWVKGPNSGNSQCDGAGQTECFTFSGSHSVTVKAVAAEISLTADRYVVYVGKASVKFTAAPFPKKFGSKFTPMQIQSWKWTPDGGSTISACGTGATCTYTPATSGTMKVQAVVNGVVRTKSIHILKQPCPPTGDPLFDSLPVADMLKMGWDSSGGANPDITQKKERYGGVECDSVSGCIGVLYPSSPLDTPCRVYGPPLDTLGVRKAGGHIHPFRPFKPGMPVGSYDTLPDICSDLSDTATTAAGFGPSDPEDYDHVGGPGQELPHYVMDADSIYAIPGGPMSSGDRKSNTESYPRMAGQCQRI